MKQELVQLYKEMYDMTSGICSAREDECQKYKDNPYRCCETRYCEQARQLARAEGIVLLDTGVVPGLPFMGKSGCIVPPHLRPICTLHVCTISFAERSHVGDAPDGLRKYQELRRRIEQEEQHG